MPVRKKNQNQSWIVFIVMGGIFIFGSAVGLLLMNQQNSPQVTQQPAVVDPIAAVPRITLEDAKIAFDNGDAVFLDVRTAQEYEQSHIPGTTFIPYAELQTRLGELDPTAQIITYCT
jgi:hypothetical protein